jgi:hypothetical protein
VRKRISFPVLALAIISVLFNPAIYSLPSRDGQTASPSVSLESILAKAADYCRRLEASVLDFVCREEVSATVDLSHETGSYDPRATAAAYSFVYDYQCVRTNRVLKETRTLLKMNGRDCLEPDSPLKTPNIAYRNALLSPNNLFAEKSQLDYDFRITGREKFDKREVVAIEASPRADAGQPRCLSGKAWIDPETGNILMIEWTQLPGERADIFVGREEMIKGALRLTLRTEFREEKNRMRFPSRLSIEEAYINKRGRTFVHSTTNVIYKNFKFFTVEVDVR